jgi:hypothetical protein
MKRFLDTDIWKKKWFRLLEPAEKTAWFYIVSMCDNVGVWDADTDAADFHIGSEINWDTFPEKVHENVEIMANGKWYLCDFCFFQHSDLVQNPGGGTKNRAIESYVRELKRHGLYDTFYARATGVGTGIEGASERPVAPPIGGPQRALGKGKGKGEGTEATGIKDMFDEKTGQNGDKSH